MPWRIVAEDPPVLELEDIAAPDAPAYRGGPVVVRADGFLYPLRLRVRPGADTLFVMLNGMVDRTKTALPVFARWNWDRVLHGHVLSVCDPTLYRHAEMGLGWFVGSADAHAAVGLRRIAETVRRSLGVAAGRRIFYGSSGGGFAALVAASQIDEGRAVAINAQMSVLSYYPRKIAPLLETFGGPEATLRRAQAQPERWTVQGALECGARLGYRPRLVVAQNLADPFHHAKHFVPTMQALGVPVEGGVGCEGRVLAMTYDSPEGHSAEPPIVVKRLVQEGIPFLVDCAPAMTSLRHA